MATEDIGVVNTCTQVQMIFVHVLAFHERLDHHFCRETGLLHDQHWPTPDLIPQKLWTKHHFATTSLSFDGHNSVVSESLLDWPLIA